MAVDLNNTDSLLLSSKSQFSTDDMKSRSNCHNQPIKQTSSSSSSCFSFSDFGSSMSSPVESEMGSNESASDQDDEYIDELTRQMAHHMLDEDDENKAWNLKKNEEETCFGCSLQPISVPSSTTMKEPKSSNLDFQSKQALIDYQIRAIQFYKFKKEQITKQKEESLNCGKKANEHNNKEANRQFHQSKGRGFNLQKASWPNLPQQKGTVNSQMTAFFLGDNKSGSRTGSCGTGVFLPRGIGNTCDSRKKSGCSTVLIPARVVQALKLHFDKMGVEPRFPHGASFPIQDDGLLMDEVSYGQQQVQKKSQARPEPANNHHHHHHHQDIGLPQEWTY